jgi:two-component system, cell cycle sensor histidine kinase and response regulator CckA
VIDPVVLDLNQILRGSEKLLRRVLGEDVALVVDLQPEPWTVRCDQGQMEQVIMNLAVNARDAMPRGGALRIETRNVDVTEGNIELTGGRPGHHVRLAVRDSGAGMSEEARAHLFEPFFTTKPRGQGTGLGLATVYGIVKQSGGHIRVESEPGRGTTFEMYFPQVEGRAVSVERPAVATTRGTETVLVVEDERPVREVTVRVLRSAGYRVLVAESGQAALDLDPRELATVRLLVTDVVMPGLDGREVAQALGRGCPGLRVLYVSGYAQDAVAQRGGLAPGTDLLEKPFTPSVLLGRVRAVLDRPEGAAVPAAGASLTRSAL